MSAVETLYEVTQHYCFLPEHLWINWMRKDKPGEAYERLPEETKAKLRELKSDDLKKLRPDAVNDLTGWCQHQADFARDYIRRHP
jgi:hypothetical protein